MGVETWRGDREANIQKPKKDRSILYVLGRERVFRGGLLLPVSLEYKWKDRKNTIRFSRFCYYSLS